MFIGSVYLIAWAEHANWFSNDRWYDFPNGMLFIIGLLLSWIADVWLVTTPFIYHKILPNTVSVEM
jgi:hypothetical protein